MTPPTPRQVLDRRRDEQAALLARAERFAAGLDPALDVRAVVVFGSVARGDFHDTSDVDVLVVAARLPSSPLDRNAAVGVAPPRVEYVAWCPDEWRRELERGNPITIDVGQHGRVLRGTLDHLSD